MVKFTDLFDDCTSQGVKLPTEEYKDKGKFLVVDQGQDVIAGYTDRENGVYTDVPAIIFGDHTRVIKYVDKPFFLGADGTKLLKCKDTNANYRYLYYALRNARIPNTGYNRHYKWLKEVEIEYPDADRQTEVAEILGRVEKLIAERKNELEKLDTLIKARFVEMFGNPVRNEKGWTLATVGDVADIKIGPFGTLIHKEDYIAGRHALVNPSHIVDGKICIDPKLTISDEKYEELSSYKLMLGDVVLGRRGEMGRCAVVHEEGLLCGTGSMILRPNEKMKPYFLQNIISSPTYKKIIEDKAVGVTMQNLNVPIVSTLTIPLLPIDLQDEFIEVIKQVDKSKVVIQKSLDETQLLFDSLMQEYFG